MLFYDDDLEDLVQVTLVFGETPLRTALWAKDFEQAVKFVCENDGVEETLEADKTETILDMQGELFYRCLKNFAEKDRWESYLPYLIKVIFNFGPDRPKVILSAEEFWLAAELTFKSEWATETRNNALWLYS